MSKVIPFLPLPASGPLCACGEPLSMEMERDTATCVECQRLTSRIISAPTGIGKTMAALHLAAPRTVLLLADRCGRA